MTRAARALVAALLLAAPLARAQGPAPAATPIANAAPSATPAAAPAQFTLDEIGDRAEDVATQLRDMNEMLADSASYTQLEDRVLGFSHRVGDRSRDTDRILGGSLRRGPLSTLSSSWRALRTELLAVRVEVDDRLAQREANLATIDRLKETWAWTLDRVKAANAPAQVVGRVQETVAAIDATREQVDARHSSLLVLQDAVSRAMQTCDDAISRVAESRKQAVSRAFAMHEPPLWVMLRAPAAGVAKADRTAQIRSDIGTGGEAVQIYLQAYRSGFVLSALIGIFFAAVLYRERNRARRAASAGLALPDFVTFAFRSPLSTALLLTLVVTRPLRPDPPAALQHFAVLIGLPAALTVLRPLLDTRLMRACFAFTVFFLVDLARLVLHLPPAIEQPTLILEMAAASGVMLWASSALATATGSFVVHSHWMHKAGRRLLIAGAFATGFASLAAVLGYLELADFVGGGALSVAYLAIGVLAFRVAAGSAIWLALVESPLKLLRTVDRNRARMEAGLSRALEVASLGIWIAVALQTFELLDPAIELVTSMLGAELKVGALSVSVGRVLGFFAVVGIAWLMSRIVIFALEEDVYPRMALARGVPYAVSTMIRYGLLLAGFFAALATVGLDLTRLTVLVSAFGLGLGFGMQQIINNFVSGLILLFERPVQVGDLVQMNDLAGQVLRIGIRSSTIRTPDGAEVIIPNSDLIQNDVTNWTLSDRRRRITIEVGVVYGVEADRVLALLLEVAKREPRVVADPGPESLFIGFGASSLDFQLRFWTDEANWWRLKSDVTVALQTALREAGIEVPFTTITLLSPEPPR